MAFAALPSCNGGFQTLAHFAPQGGKVGRKYYRSLLENGIRPQRRVVCPGFSLPQAGAPGRHAKAAVARLGGAAARGGAAAFSSQYMAPFVAGPSPVRSMDATLPKAPATIQREIRARCDPKLGAKNLGRRHSGNDSEGA